MPERLRAVKNVMERDTKMTGTYVLVMIVEAAIVVALVLLGRLYS